MRGGTKDFGFLPIPKSLQYDSTRAFQFTTVLNVTFGFASTFSMCFELLSAKERLTLDLQLLRTCITVNPYSVS